MGVEKRQIGMDEMAEQPLLNIGDDPLAVVFITTDFRHSWPNL